MSAVNVTDSHSAHAPAGGPSDADLLRRAVCGDHGCFEELVARHKDELEEATRSLTSSAAEARDLMERTVATAWSGARYARAGDDAGPWLIAVARYEASRNRLLSR